jgi:hypothetical protein
LLKAGRIENQCADHLSLFKNSMSLGRLAQRKH